MQDQLTLVKLCECGCGRPAPNAPSTNRSKGWVEGQPLRYCKGHQTRRQGQTSDYRVENRGYSTPCWVWQLAVARATGYGLTKMGGVTVGAHRKFWEAEHGPVPAGMHLDHLCRVRHCVNPQHLEVVTPAENKRRGAGVKLTAADIPVIRARCAAGESHTAVGRDYGVSDSAIYSVHHRKSWKDIP